MTDPTETPRDHTGCTECGGTGTVYLADVSGWVPEPCDAYTPADLDGENVLSPEGVDAMHTLAPRPAAPSPVHHGHQGYPSDGDCTACRAAQDQTPSGQAQAGLNAILAALPDREADPRPCDGGCSVENGGPQEECSRHGRPVAEVWGIVEALRRREFDAQAERNEARQALADLRAGVAALAVDWREDAEHHGSVSVAAATRRHANTLTALLADTTSGAEGPTPSSETGREGHHCDNCAGIDPPSCINYPGPTPEPDTTERSAD